MHEQLIVSIQDLRFATIACPHCNTRVTLDLAAEFEPGSGHTAFDCLRECPRCHARFDSAIPGGVNAMQKAYKALEVLGNAVTFTSGAETQGESK